MKIWKCQSKTLYCRNLLFMWFFKNWWLKRQYSQMPFKMKNWTESQKSSCIEQNIDDLDRILKKFNHNNVRIKIKERKDVTLNTHKDIFGNYEPLKQPIFAQNEIASCTRKNYWEKFLIFLLIVFEGIIYSQLVTLMIPREIRAEYWWASLAAGLALSLIILLVVRSAIERYYTYIDAKTTKQLKNLPDSLMTKFIIKKNIGLVLFGVFLVVNISAGILREKVLLGANADSSLGRIVFFMAMGLSFLTAFVLALLEIDLHEKNNRYKVYRNWEKNNKERKRYFTSIKDMLHRADMAISKNMEMYWSLVLDLQRIFRQRIDEEDSTLYEEFRNKVGDNLKPSELSDSLYYHYQPIQCADEHLFKYGIMRDERILQKMTEVKQAVNEIEEWERNNNETSGNE